MIAKILIIAAFIGMLVFIVVYSRKTYCKESKEVESLIYEYKIKLRSCYSIKELRELKMDFEQSIFVIYGEDYLKLAIPPKCRCDAKILLAVIEERINLLELSYLPKPKVIKEEVK